MDQWWPFIFDRDLLDAVAVVVVAVAAAGNECRERTERQCGGGAGSSLADCCRFHCRHRCPSWWEVRRMREEPFERPLRAGAHRWPWSLKQFCWWQVKCAAFVAIWTGACEGRCRGRRPLGSRRTRREQRKMTSRIGRTGWGRLLEWMTTTALMEPNSSPAVVAVECGCPSRKQRCRHCLRLRSGNLNLPSASWAEEWTRREAPRRTRSERCPATSLD